MIRSLIGFSIIFYSSLLLHAKEPRKIRYPYISGVNAKVSLVEEKKETRLKKSDILKEKALIRTDDKSQVKVQLSSSTELVIFENSEVNLPFIAWEDGSLEQIEIKKGRIRIEINDNSPKTIVTALSQESIKKGDYVFTYEPLFPRVQVMVLTGELEFRGLENEESIKLKTGEKASFEGILEAGLPAYDILLKGRKVARGKLTKPQKISKEELNNFLKVVEFKMSPKKAEVVKRTESQICDKPFGELNQCVWQCENNPKKATGCMTESGAVCVRMRCNANGEWAEKQNLPSQISKCGSKPIVAACDY